ncbi:MAG: pyridoxamine 5'-phosphate oxidase family protein [Chitinophagaceae bacterium]|nr:MAG: pyridoxamine 5'-phosphate oxidase family protein [Chitinophagaceae bacterium]
MLGTLDPVQIEDVLTKGMVGRLGCHADGETYIVPISYAYDGQYIYCHTHEGKKTALLRKNPSVCFQVDEMQDMANWKSVIVQGNFEELKEAKQRVSGMQTLLNRYLPVISSMTTHLGRHWPFQPEDINEIDGIVFRISVREKTGKYELGQASPQMQG